MTLLTLLAGQLPFPGGILVRDLHPCGEESSPEHRLEPELRLAEVPPAEKRELNPDRLDARQESRQDDGARKDPSDAVDMQYWVVGGVPSEYRPVSVAVQARPPNRIVFIAVAMVKQ